MALPCERSSAARITSGSVESIISGTLTLRTTWSRNAVTSASSSRSGSARHTSTTWAPPRTCRRPTSAASSNAPAAINRLNRREPMTFVRSPTSSGRLSSSITSGSSPDTALPACRGGRRGVLPSSIRSSRRMCAGVVPQQPPSMFSQPWSTKRSSLAASDSGDSL